MNKLSTDEMRSIDAGASKYVTCPICGYKSKSSLIERLFWSNARRKMYLEARHYSIGKGYNGSKSAHR